MSYGVPKKIRTKDPKLLKDYQTGLCVLCASPNTEAHHIVSRGSGGPDEVFNLLKICRICHNKIHQIGLKESIRRNVRLLFVLRALGWTWENEELWHPKLID